MPALCRAVPLPTFFLFVVLTFYERDSILRWKADALRWRQKEAWADKMGICGKGDFMGEMENKALKKEWPACPVETTLTLIGDKWKVLILRDLLTGTKRFGELKRSIGSVSQKVLTAQLRAMEKDGLVHRKVYAEVLPRVEYSLTELGRSLKPILDSMRRWGEEYKASMR